MSDLRKPHWREIRETLSGKREQIHIWMSIHGPCTAIELAAKINWDKTSVRPRLCELLKAGLVEETGERRNGEHVFSHVPLALAEQRRREADQPAFQLQSE